MSTTLAEAQASLAKDDGVLKKLFTAIKKLFAKEFLWILFVLILGLPLGLLLTYIIQHFASAAVLHVINEIIQTTPLFIACYLMSLVGIYFTRTVVGAIDVMVNKSKG